MTIDIGDVLQSMSKFREGCEWKTHWRISRRLKTAKDVQEARIIVENDPKRYRVVKGESFVNRG